MEHIQPACWIAMRQSASPTENVQLQPNVATILIQLAGCKEGEIFLTVQTENGLQSTRSIARRIPYFSSLLAKDTLQRLGGFDQATGFPSLQEFENLRALYEYLHAGWISTEAYERQYVAVLSQAERLLSHHSSLDHVPLHCRKQFRDYTLVLNFLSPHIWASRINAHYHQKKGFTEGLRKATDYCRALPDPQENGYLHQRAEALYLGPQGFNALESLFIQATADCFAPRFVTVMHNYLAAPHGA